MRIYLAAWAITASLPFSAQAQILPDIIVSGQKREQSIRDVPIATTFLSAEDLQLLGVEQFDDLANFVPGLEVQEQSANNPSFVIRGITSDSGEATIEPRVSIYQDGVSISRSRGSFVELMDSTVEVLRGPQPTLFGRGALIGAVNVTSNAPELDAHQAEVKASIGNLNYRQIDALINIPLANDIAAMRGVLRYKSRDGYIENLIGEDLNGYDTFAGRLSLAVAPTDQLDILLVTQMQRDDNPGTAFKSGTFISALDDSTSPFERAAISSFGDLHDGRPLGVERDLFNITGQIDYRITEDLSLTSISNFREFESFEVFDADGFDYPLFSFGEEAESKQFSQELRLNISNGDTFAGFVGASYFSEDGFQTTHLGATESLVQALLGGFLFTDLSGTPQTPLALALIPQVNANPESDFFGASLGIHNEEATNFGETRSWDLFADASFSVTDKLEITTGLRYTKDDKISRYAAQSDSLSNLTGVGLLLGTGIVSNGAPVTAKDSFDGLTWRLAGHYAASDTLTFFANYAKGRRPEILSYNYDAADLSVLQTGQLADNFERVDAETVSAYEAGLKSQFWDNRIYADLSVYHYDYENFQSTVIDAQSGQSRTVNEGNAGAFGIEGSLRAKLSDTAELYGVYAYTDAQFDSTDNDGNRQDLAGNRFRLTPEHSFTIAGQFTRKFMAGDILFAPSYAWKSDIFFDNDNVRTDESQSSYGILDARLVYTPVAQNWSAELFANNVTDRDYLLDAGNVGGIFGIPTFIAAPPRTYGLTISYEF